MTDIVERLRGIYRIPITDGLGPAGGDEPSNASEFVRRFEAPPIQREAADEIERLRARIGELETALRPFADFGAALGERHEGCDIFGKAGVMIFKRHDPGGRYESWFRDGGGAIRAPLKWMHLPPPPEDV